jgi:hypothetical protein
MVSFRQETVSRARSMVVIEIRIINLRYNMKAKYFVIPAALLTLTISAHADGFGTGFGIGVGLSIANRVLNGGQR